MPPLLIHVVDRLCHELHSDCESFPHTFTAQIRRKFFFEPLRTEPMNIVGKSEIHPIVLLFVNR